MGKRRQVRSRAGLRWHTHFPAASFRGGCHRRREPKVSAITSQASLFQTHFHLTGHLPSFKEDAFLSHGLGTMRKPCSLEAKTLPLSKLPHESSSLPEKGHQSGGLTAGGARAPLSHGPRGATPVCMLTLETCLPARHRGPLSPAQPLQRRREGRRRRSRKHTHSSLP